MTFRGTGTGGFEFVRVSALRAAQLMRGCTPRVLGSQKLAVTAQHEVAERKVVRSANAGDLGEPIE